MPRLEPRCWGSDSSIRRKPSTMTTLIQILTAIGALGGCLVAIIRLHRHFSMQTKELESMSLKLERREQAIQTLLGRYQDTHRRLMRQLEQAEIYFDIEQELATRLADVEGGKPITKKSHARSAVMNRRKGDVALITRVTTPSGIRDQKHQADEAMVETMNVDLRRLHDDTSATRTASQNHSRTAA